MRVVIEPPDIQGDTVTFKWQQSHPNKFQRKNSFFFRYEGIELNSFSSELLYELFLGLQLRVFSAMSETVEVIFPSAVPGSTIAYWTAFHDAANVSVSPVAEIVTYNPWSSTPRLLPESRKVAVFFGGGKDSTLAASLFSELEGHDQVLLVQFVGPLRDDPKLWSRLEKRQQKLMLEATTKRLELRSQRVWTDFQAQFLETGYHLRPNLELYTLGALPALLAWGCTCCTFSIPWTMYSTQTTADGCQVFRYSRSRPEELTNLTRHYHQVLDASITVTNITFPLASHVTYELLAKRYPEAARGIVSCTQGGIDEPWCYKCSKCSGIAIWSLASGAPLPSFDYDHFFRKSPFIREIVNYAESGVELRPDGNAPWNPVISTRRGYHLVCSMIAKIDRATVPADLSNEALGNLALLTGLFGNRQLPEYHAVPEQALAMLGPELASRLKPIIASHLPLSDSLPAANDRKNGAEMYDFSGAFIPRTSTVPHIQESRNEQPAGSSDLSSTSPGGSQST